MLEDDCLFLEEVLGIANTGEKIGSGKEMEKLIRSLLFLMRPFNMM